MDQQSTSHQEVSMEMSDEGCVEEVLELSQSLEEHKVRKRLRTNHLPIEAKIKIANVYNTFKEADGASGAIAKTSQYTMTPYSTVWYIINKGISPRMQRNDAGVLRTLKPEEHANVIRRIIYNGMKEKYVHTLESLRQKIVEDLSINCCKETLRKFLKEIGFHFKKLDKRQVLMESREISGWRVRYLTKIEECRRQNRSIFYLDETWYDTHDTVKKGWTDGTGKCRIDVPPSRGKRIIILHVGNENGFIPGALLLSAKDIREALVDYHENMTAELFQEWFKKTLLPKLPPQSIIVMDNAKYHSAQMKTIPNSNSNKATIMDFLHEHDLYYEETYTKKQLLEVLRTRTYDKEYVIDNEAIKHGHEVVRLPPYHCVFNPIELIWGQLKSHIRRRNQYPKFSEKMVEVIKEEVTKITAENWAGSLRHVIEIENSYG